MKPSTHALAGVLICATALEAAAQSFTFEKAWSLAPGDRSYLTTDNTQRGMAYNAATGNLLLVNRAGGVSINKIRASDGADMGTLSLGSGIVTGGTFAANLVGVAGDGAIYLGNLSAPASPALASFKLYKWDNEASAAPSLVYSGSVTDTSARFGDTLAVRGSGATTQVLLGGRASQFAGLLTATDASATVFGASQISVSAPMVSASNGPMGLGLAFGGANDFWATTSGGPVYNFSLETGATLHTLTTPVVPLTLINLGVDASRGLMATINLVSGHDEFTLFDISNPSELKTLDLELFGSNNANGNGVGAVAFGGDMVFALGTNNGIMAMSLVAVPEPAEVALLSAVLLGGFAVCRRRQAAKA
jgi:hypothetical protein